ncbi:MAG: hypothetical protein O3C40_03545 [Planctomycetota bacterium]|nr:hypothetical protein [Planctomycetota bacterium]
MGKDPGSIPMDDPLALFLTWTTYGSWLPGDEWEWVEKAGRFRELDAHRDEAKVLPRRWGTIMMKALEQVRANGVL